MLHSVFNSKLPFLNVCSYFPFSQFFFSEKLEFCICFLCFSPEKEKETFSVINDALCIVAYRRYQASQWLEDMAGPLDLSPNPSEQEFVSCLRSGHVLCTAINKIQPGAVPKVYKCFGSSFHSFLMSDAELEFVS